MSFAFNLVPTRDDLEKFPPLTQNTYLTIDGMQFKTLHSMLQLKAFPTNNNKSPPILGFTKPPFPPK